MQILRNSCPRYSVPLAEVMSSFHNIRFIHAAIFLQGSALLLSRSSIPSNIPPMYGAFLQTYCTVFLSIEVHSSFHSTVKPSFNHTIFLPKHQIPTQYAVTKGAMVNPHCRIP